MVDHPSMKNTDFLRRRPTKHKFENWEKNSGEKKTKPTDKYFQDGKKNEQRQWRWVSSQYHDFINVTGCLCLITTLKIQFCKSIEEKKSHLAALIWSYILIIWHLISLHGLVLLTKRTHSGHTWRTWWRKSGEKLKRRTAMAAESE